MIQPEKEQAGESDDQEMMSVIRKVSNAGEESIHLARDEDEDEEPVDNTQD